MDITSARILSQLQQTPTGLGLLNSVVVLPVTETPRTGIDGVPVGAINLYYDDDDDLVLQAWNQRKGEWQEVTLA